MNDPPVLLLPPWRDAGPAHWQSRWATLHGAVRVEQDDWLWPRRGDWMARLEEVLLALPAPAVLVADGLACQLVAAWAAHSANTARVRAALLVAPTDTEAVDLPPQIALWRPIARRRLPFAALAVTGAGDPPRSAERAAALFADWGCAWHCTSPAGGDLPAGDWPAGRALLRALIEASA